MIAKRKNELFNMDKKAHELEEKRAKHGNNKLCMKCFKR